MDIHDVLVKNKKFIAGIKVLYEKKPVDLAILKACEELSELTTKLLQRVTKGTHTTEDILEELIDVQMHVILLEKYFNFEQRKGPVVEKVEKMLNSKDYHKYLKL